MAEPVLHSEETAPAEAQPLLAAARKKFGFVPNLAGVLAAAPSALEGYLALGGAFEKSSFSPVQQQVVALAVSYFHGCAYCMSAHSMVAAMAGMKAPELEALRQGGVLSEPKLEALRVFTTKVVEHRGRIPAPEVEAFLAAGYTTSQVLEVNLGIAFKTLSNYTHAILPFPIDAQFMRYAWGPRNGARTGTRVLITGWLRPDGGRALSEYVAGAGPIMSKYGGRPLLRSQPNAGLVGDKADLVVMMEFPSPEAASGSFADADYLKLVPLRNEAFSRLEVTDIGAAP